VAERPESVHEEEAELLRVVELWVFDWHFSKVINLYVRYIGSVYDISPMHIVDQVWLIFSFPN